MAYEYYPQDFAHEETEEDAEANIITIVVKKCAELDEHFTNAQGILTQQFAQEYFTRNEGAHTKNEEITLRADSTQMIAYHTAIKKGLVADYSAYNFTHSSDSAHEENFTHIPSSAHGAQTGSAHTYCAEHAHNTYEGNFPLSPIFPQDTPGDISTQSAPAHKEFVFEKDVAERLDRCVRDHPTVDINNIVNQRVKDFLDEVDSAERG